MVCLQAEVDKIIHCENLKLTKIKLAINKKASPFSSEMTEEEKNYTKKNFPKIEQNVKNRIEAYKNLKKHGTNRYQNKINDMVKVLPGSSISSRSQGKWRKEAIDLE
ncbi:MAG: hypothetical protein KDK36_14580 [Leptospiraceae bacterium]|nr:hypothetical protein [Leptospiraceae bacterium]